MREQVRLPTARTRRSAPPSHPFLPSRQNNFHHYTTGHNTFHKNWQVGGIDLNQHNNKI